MADDANVEVPPAKADNQDPLPENDWKFRRAFAYVTCLWLLILLTLGMIWLRNLESPDNLLSLGIAVAVLLGLVITYYMIAPSAEHITRIFQTASAIKTGAVFKSTAEVVTDQVHARTSSVAGKPPATPTSPAGDTQVIE